MIRRFINMKVGHLHVKSPNRKVWYINTHKVARYGYNTYLEKKESALNKYFTIESAVKEKHKLQYFA